MASPSAASKPGLVIICPSVGGMPAGTANVDACAAVSGEIVGAGSPVLNPERRFRKAPACWYSCGVATVSGVGAPGSWENVCGAQLILSRPAADKAALY